MDKVKELLCSFRLIHTLIRRLLLFCVSYTYLIVLAAVMLRMLAGRGIEYYTAVQWANDLFAAIRPCVGVTALGGLLVEGALHAAEHSR